MSRGKNLKGTTQTRQDAFLFVLKNVKKSVLFPPQNVTSKASQRHIKGNSNGGQFKELL